MEEQQLKLITVLKNVFNKTLVLNNKEKIAIINYVKEEDMRNAQICINCMKDALQLWKNEGVTEESLVVFMDILIEFSKSKDTFVLLHQNNILKGVIHVFHTTDYTKDCDVYRKYIQLLDTFTYHKCGNNWLVDFWDCWKNVFKVISTQKYTEELSVLLKNLFSSVVDSNEYFSINLSKLILQPLTIVCIRIARNNLIGILEEDLCHNIMPTLNLLSSVIMCISAELTLNSPWLKHCSKLLEFQKPLTILLEIVEGNELTRELSKLLAGLHFLELAHNSNKFHEFTKLFFYSTLKMINLNTTRQFVDNIVVLSYHLQHYWHHISRLFDVTKLDLPCHFDEFICLYQIVALLGTCKQILGKQYGSNMKADMFRYDYVENLINKLGKPILLNMRQMAEYIFTKDSLLIEVHLSLDYISKSLHLHNKECRIITFNALVYFLGDIILDIHKNKGIKSKFYDSNLVTHFINTFIFYGGECNVTWKDVTTHMLAVVTATDLLQVQNLPFEVTVAALKMLDLAIAKRMAPDLTLLVDCKSLNSIGILLDSKLNCENVEVRCAASKVLVTVSETAKSSYPFFQKILLDSDLPQQILTRMLNKGVVEVRRNSMKCLQHLVRISSIWDVISSFRNILDSIINLLQTETEDLLKTELVNLVAVIYEEDYFNDLQVNKLYDIITPLGVNDSDVTLRISCLKFWNVVINKLQIEEGMIDGEFPEVTFSKETKKIVVLDEDEITRRLKRLMKKLSENGCLTVLNYCFMTKDREEKQCIDEIVYDLLVILKTHNIDERNVELSRSKRRKNKFKTFIMDNLVLEMVDSREFLKNVTQMEGCSNEGNFVVVLDEILKNNNNLYS